MSLRSGNETRPRCGGGCGSRDKENTLQNMESLPIINFSSPDRLATAKELTKAMETIGFVYLDNVPGFNKEVEENLHKAASWFFSLPLDEKLRVSPKKWNPDANGVFRG